MRRVARVLCVTAHARAQVVIEDYRGSALAFDAVRVDVCQRGL